MALKNLLSKMDLDRWYKIPVYTGFFVFMIALTLPIRVLPNGPVMVVSLGAFLWGLGEWRKPKPVIEPMRIHDIMYGGLNEAIRNAKGAPDAMASFLIAFGWLLMIGGVLLIVWPYLQALGQLLGIT